jgi:CBS-domain-containing membrane protein
MKSVANNLKSKSDPTVYTIAPNASVFDALKLMAEKSIGALVVMEGEQVVGIMFGRRPSKITRRRRRRIGCLAGRGGKPSVHYCVVVSGSTGEGRAVRHAAAR